MNLWIFLLNIYQLIMKDLLNLRVAMNLKKKEVTRMFLKFLKMLVAMNTEKKKVLTRKFLKILMAMNLKKEEVKRKLLKFPKMFVAMKIKNLLVNIRLVLKLVLTMNVKNLTKKFLFVLKMVKMKRKNWRKTLKTKKRKVMVSLLTKQLMT
uniref:Uncharacterized protein n=1 Tax=Cacopsylla melanoneura TaxID=428564 RepID=A0A8D8RTZ5_9HEMI